jgi:MSHA pilin protein MshC
MERTGNPRDGMFAPLLCSMRNRGFTLVELVTTMVIIGVLAAVLAPRFLGRQGFEARGFYDASAAAIRYAQKTAIAKRRPVFVVVTGTQVSVCYNISPCSQPVTDPATGTALLIDAKRGNASLAAPVAVTPVTSFSFDGLGQPSFTGAPLVLTYTPIEAGDVTRTLSVEPGTGYVHQ